MDGVLGGGADGRGRLGALICPRTDSSHDALQGARLDPRQHLHAGNYAVYLRGCTSRWGQRGRDRRSTSYPAPTPGLVRRPRPPRVLPARADVRRLRRDAALRRSVLVNTEQPGTPWFERCLRAAGVPASSSISARMASRRSGQLGIERSITFRSATAQSSTADGGDGEDQVRDLDIVFMGDLNTWLPSDLLATIRSCSLS